MDIPKVGVALPIFEPYAGPDAISKIALAAERLGFHSVGVSERLLIPATPGWHNAYGLPDHHTFDALETLTWVAGQTRHVRLTTTVLNPLFQSPVIVARRLATLDRLSSGRLDLGIALGWMPEEFAVAGVPPDRHGARFEDHLAAMKACWGPDPVEHDGPFYQIARAKIGPKPARTMRIAIGGTARPAIERAARLGDGVSLAFWNWDAVREPMAWYRAAGGTGPIVIHAGPGPDPAAAFSGPTERLVADFQRAAAEGIDEVIFNMSILGVEPNRQVARLEKLAAALALEPRPAD